MSPEVYLLLHVAGVMCLFLGLGGVLAATDGGKPAKLFTILHGVGLLVMLVAGFGRAQKMGYGVPNWVIAKIACWVVLGAVPVLIRRGVLPRFIALLLVLGVGATAAWLAQAKPF